MVSSETEEDADSFLMRWVNSSLCSMQYFTYRLMSSSLASTLIARSDFSLLSSAVPNLVVMRMFQCLQNLLISAIRFAWILESDTLVQASRASTTKNILPKLWASDCRSSKTSQELGKHSWGFSLSYCLISWGSRLTPDSLCCNSWARKLA